MADPFTKRLFELHLNQLQRHVRKNGVKGLESLYKEAKADLYDRLLQAGGSSATTPTALQLRAMIAQVDAVTESLGKNLNSHLKDISKSASEMGARHGIDEFKKLEKHFTGNVPVLQIETAAQLKGLVKDTTSSLLRRYSLASSVWSNQAIQDIEQAMSVGSMAGKPTNDIIQEVMGKTGILEQERWRAERIVRTETAFAHGRSKYDAMKRTSEELGEKKLYKRLIETLDNRTGDDSFVLHGQTVPIDEPFRWKHKRAGSWVVTEYQHPPNRPNDRAVVIPWDPSWEETSGERPLTRAELNTAPPTRWRKKAGVEIPPGHRPGKPAR